jgi:cellulose synthase/poly-beta-1,6-N-acetylglucosamine synthase-like glycosyltransferase
MKSEKASDASFETKSILNFSRQSSAKSVLDVKKVSIIVAYSPSRKNLLRRFLDSLEFVDVDECIQAELLLSCEGNRSECLNDLVKRASGDILLFFDDDVELRSNTIQELLKPFSSEEFENVGIVGGVNIRFKNVLKSERRSDALLTNTITMFKSRSRYTPVGDTRAADESEVVTCNMAILRKAFEEAGGFPEDIIPCEENVLANRIAGLGYSIVYTPFAIVYHRRPKLFKEYAKTIFNYGKGRGLMMRRHQGNPKLFYKPSWDWAFIVAGVFVHYASYVSGVIYGYFKKPKRTKKHCK